VEKKITFARLHEKVSNNIQALYQLVRYLLQFAVVQSCNTNESPAAINFTAPFSRQRVGMDVQFGSGTVDILALCRTFSRVYAHNSAELP
jgi:hypothetical protein